MPIGRFAPSPTGPLHVGNLRTALVAWLAARSDGSALLLRSEDLDPASRPDHEAIGVDWDGPVVRQSERRELYEAAVDRLTERGLTYPCYCTRREVREATRAPHGDRPEGTYPGTCRHLTAIERGRRQAEGRPPALRLRANGARATAIDALAGEITGVVDDVVLRRNDGLPAYNLVVVVDDAAQGVEEVVRADDLLASTPRQVHLAHLLVLPVPRYFHVPLVVGPDGRRLAKRHGAVTLADLAAAGVGAEEVRDRLLASLGLPAPGSPTPLAAACDAFDRSSLPREPWPADLSAEAAG